MTTELEDHLISRNEELLDEHKIQEAETVAKEVLDLDPEDALPLYIYGRTLYMEEKFDDALSYLSKAAQLDRERPEVWQVIGYCLIAMGRYQEAVQPLEYVVAVQPDNVEARYTLGIVYLILGDDRYEKIIRSAFEMSKQRSVRLAEQVYLRYISKSSEVDPHTKSVIERVIERLKMPEQI